MFRKIGYLLMIIAVLAATGSHWVVLQSVAWTTMLADNLQTRPFTEAVQRTFNGKHPCCLCKQICEGKRSEKKSEAQIELKKPEFSHTPTVFVFTSPTQFYEVRAVDDSPDSASHAPPVPPPRSFFI